MRPSEVAEYALKTMTTDNPIRKDLEANNGASIVIAGEQQPAWVHALAHQWNAQLGNVGKTVFYTDPVDAIRWINWRRFRTW